MLGIALVAVLYLVNFTVEPEEEIQAPNMKKLEPAKE